MNEEQCEDHDWETFPDDPDTGYIGHQQCKNCGKERVIPVGWYDDPDLDY
jgi:hypothetical protein